MSVIRDPHYLLRYVLAVLLLLLLWQTRIPALDALPLHNDEGLHLTRAVEVWQGHPFWNISDGKIINHWPIAALYPQHAPDWAGRLPTVMVAMIGLAAGLALAWRMGGLWALLLAGVLWLTTPYLFFFERLALSDAQAGAWVVVAVLLAVRTADYGRWRDAVLTGLALGLAVLFKFTAAPYALAVVIVLLGTGRQPFWQRARLLLLAGLVSALCFVPPLLYLLLRGQDFFSIALGWIGTGGGQGLALSGNVTRLVAQLTGFGTWGWALLLAVGLGLALRPAGRLVLAWALPLLVMMVFGREVLPRHFVVALPLACVLAGIGLGWLVTVLDELRERATMAAVIVVVLALGLIPFAGQAYRAPGTLPLPDLVRTQYITDHSGGFGLRDALRSLPETITRPELPIIGSMFPDSCRRANFYAVDDLRLRCANAPGLAEVQAALASQGAVYVLADNAPLIGLDVTTVPVRATRVAAYPRPGETADNASVVLWLLETP